MRPILHRPTPARHGARRTLLAALAVAVTAGACGGDGPTSGRDDPGTVPDTTPATLAVRGLGEVTARYTAEVAVSGTTAYTTSWNRRGTVLGNAIHVWDVSGATPTLVDTVLVEDAATLGDVQISDDGALLLVAVEPSPVGAVVLYDLADPRRPQRLTRYASASTATGVHTAKLARVNGTLHAFLAVDPSPSRLVVLDLSDPRAPREILSRPMGRPFLHDVHVRDGLLFTALWHDGLTIWDIGGGGRGGTPAEPVQLGNVQTVNGSVHNVAWVQLPAGGGRRYAWVGEEGPGGVTGAPFSSGDVHVVDISDLARPREVAFFSAAGAGTHNFAVDEAAGVVYAAYYNGGVRAFDARGDLGACPAAQRSADGRCDLAKMGRELGRGLLDRERPVYVWGVVLAGGALYASDMLNGLWKLGTVER